MSDRKHPVLRPRCRPHGPHGFEHYRKQAGERDRVNNGKNKAAPGLPRDASRRDNPVPRLGYDPQHPSGCIIFIGSERSQQSLRTFFHGMKSRPHKTHQIKWGILYAMRNFTIRRCVFRGGRIGGAIPQLQTSNNFLPHARRNGTSATTNVSTLRQLHGGRYRQ
jgi:hypothetical protein